MKVYCIIHHYGHIADPRYYENDYANERDLVTVCDTKELAEEYIVENGMKLGGAYIGRRPDWLSKDRSRFGYEVEVGPNEREWDYYAIQEQDLVTRLES